MLPSPFTTKEAHLHLLNATECSAYLYSASAREMVEDLLSERADVSSICVPEVERWLEGERPVRYPYDKTWEEAERDPWVVFHTSGTTGKGFLSLAFLSYGDDIPVLNMSLDDGLG